MIPNKTLIEDLETSADFFERDLDNQKSKKANKLKKMIDRQWEDIKANNENKLEKQIEAYLYLEKHPSKDFFGTLINLDLMHPAEANTSSLYLEENNPQLFLDNIKGSLCYSIMNELFPNTAFWHRIDLLNNFLKIGEATLEQYKNSKKRIKEPEKIDFKIKFPNLTAKQRITINNVLIRIEVENKYLGYQPEGLKIDENEIRFNDKSNEEYLFQAFSYADTCNFRRSNRSYETLIALEPQLQPLLEGFISFNKHLSQQFKQALKDHHQRFKTIYNSSNNALEAIIKFQNSNTPDLNSIYADSKCLTAENLFLLKLLKRQKNEDHEKDDSLPDFLRLRLAINNLRNKNYKSALKYLKKIKFEEYKPNINAFTARIYEELGETKKATEHWKKLSGSYKDIQKNFEILYNRNNEVGYVNTPLTKCLFFKQNADKEKPRKEFENISFIFNNTSYNNFPSPIFFAENPDGKSYALFRRIKSLKSRKTLTLEDELSHCKKMLSKADKKFRTKHPWWNEEAVFQNYKHSMISSIIDHLCEMQSDINHQLDHQKNISNLKNYDYREILNTKLIQRIGKPEILKYARPIIKYLESQERVFSHCDFHPGNMIDKGNDELCFIDSENASLASNFFDFAYLLERPHFDFSKDEKREFLNHFINALKEKNIQIIADPNKAYEYNAAFINMRIIGGYLSWAENTGKKYIKEINFHKKAAMQSIDRILERYADKKDYEGLIKLKQSLKELR